MNTQKYICLLVLLLVLCCLMISPAGAQEYVTTLIKDNPILGNNMAEANGTLFFAAGYFEPLMEEEQCGLWKSDGTTSGTVLIRRMGSRVSTGLGYLTNINGTLFFSAGNGSDYELWKCDGTYADIVKDINPGVAGSNPANLTNVNGTLYFTADDGTHGGELWKSDGSSTGTVLLKDINPGAGSSYSQWLLNINGILLFAANDGTTGKELWRSNGTTVSTSLIMDINPGEGSSNPQWLTNVGGLFFAANDGINGNELWRIDEITLDPVLLKDINPGAGSSNPECLTNVNGTLFFNANDGTNGYELWKSDGTSVGTVMVKDIYLGVSSSSPGCLTNVGGTLFFTANDGMHGSELWKSDGTSPGTVMVKDIYLGVGGSSAIYLTKVNGTLFFDAWDETHGYELWKSDGTAAGTVLVKDIYPGLDHSFPEYLTNINGTLFFTAGEPTRSGLWTSRPRESMGKFLSIIDVSNDQGGQVRIKWQRSLWDSSGWLGQVTSYSLMRRIPVGGSAMNKSGMKMPEGLVLDDTLSNYDFLMNVTALQISQYSVVAPTLGDSTSAGTNMFHFLLIAHTSDPNLYYVASVDSGYSVDNLSPAFVTGLNAIVQAGPNVELNWNPNVSDHDVGRYDIYRSDENGFTPIPSLKIGTATSPTFTDPSPVAGLNNYYRVVTVDVHGNESVPSSEAGVPVNVAKTYGVTNQWNMVSIPLILSDYTKTVVYQTAISDAFAYEGTYVTHSTLDNGIGYWVKFSEAQNLEITGLYRKVDTIDVIEDWNMIGSLSEPIQSSTITSDPPGMVVSQLFGYNGTYVTSDTMYPGKGYWIKVNQNCKLILLSADLDLAKTQAARIHIVPTSELPPAPPDGALSISNTIPHKYALEQNYPNPFNPSTLIYYQLPVESHVSLTVYTTLGQVVTTLVNEIQGAGYKSVEWNAQGMASGIYLYKLEAISVESPIKSYTQVRKMMFIK